MAIVAASGNNRRSKAALFIVCCFFAGAFPHFLAPISNLLPGITLAVLLGGYGLRVVLRDRENTFQNLEKYKSDSFISNSENMPSVDILISARDEENVIEELINRLKLINYPKQKLSVWIIDDGSQDNTSSILKSLIEGLPNFHLLQRARSAGGGKSGALNHALQFLHGEWLLILDADAQLSEDVLLRLILIAQKTNWSAVQLRKAVINPNQNLLTCFQSMEMAMDAVIQRGRLCGGGVVELRGNGQLLQRQSLDKCGGFNEGTVTDDLDLSSRLLIAGEPIGIIWNPPIQEEAVVQWSDLIKQRQRWAEGGLQRFLDYWLDLLSNKVSLKKKKDLFFFFLLQYAIPLISFSDLATSIYLRSLPLYWPLSFVALSVSGLAYWKGCSRDSEGPDIPNPRLIRLILAIIYLLHWFIVIPFVALKMAILPKKLIWVKTTHTGA
ncbi:glycosyltransferase family 2 protein [Prochlorococcus sp. MIT 1223]|uniref:glycosyltransferase n=1 Tax=Prochlorococcus sp. MIT 1223 TaxID=3096217 RepID=UPI002A75739F|nr:glycosyltransferase family 2 protein [Prochlorococcus sp. MIT 1223]